MDLATNSKAVPPITFLLNSVLTQLRSFGIRAKSGSLVKHAEILLVVETARLFTWAHAMGIIHTDNRPKLVPELATPDSQKPIIEVLKALNALVSDDYLIGRAYGCRLLGTGQETSITLIEGPKVVSAARVLAGTFNYFDSTMRPLLSDGYQQWTITDGDKFTMCVAEIRLLVSRLHRATAEIVPCSALDAMFYTRISRITEQWVAQTIVDACEFKDEYCEIETLARDRASIYDIKSYDALHLVEDFISRVPFVCQCTRVVSSKTCSKMFNNQDDRKGDSKFDENQNDLDKRVRELKDRLIRLEDFVWDAVGGTRAMPPMPARHAFNCGKPSRHQPLNPDIKNPNARIEGNGPAYPVTIRAAINHGINQMPKATAGTQGPSPGNAMGSGPSPAELMPPPPPPQPKWANPCVPATVPHVNRLTPAARSEPYTPSTSSTGAADEDGSFKDHHHSKQEWIDVPSDDSDLSGSEILDMTPPPRGAKSRNNVPAEPDGEDLHFHTNCVTTGQASGPTSGKKRHATDANSMVPAASMLT